ncbi:putative S-methyl-5-thioadenosine phosphorylase [Neoconidiobolus thromboides FSU 785]|nr:putative S-methyl-5-thioadenosine phosphorylase [Neoconidiobolus thromboides FSU 785]
MTPEPVKIGIIGGSGLYNLDGFEPIDEHYPDTPWGKPSSKIVISKSAHGHKIAFLARHGQSHAINPSEIPVRANISALKSLGVEVILAFSAVGSLREEIAPGHFVLPEQIIDRTKGLRENTFFEKGCVAHAGFAEPFHLGLSQLIQNAVKGLEVKFHDGKTLVCIEGPTFSTKAESNLYRNWGCDIINMSVVPEAKLAREAEIGYQMICMSTDYDCWRESEESVTVQAVMKIMKQNAQNAKLVLEKIIPSLEEELEDTGAEKKLLSNIKGSMKYSILTSKDILSEELRQKYKFLFPNYF